MALTSTTKAYSTITFSSGVSTNLSYDVGSIDYNPDIGDSLEVYADDTELTSGFAINTTSKKIELNEITSNAPTNIIIKRIANKTSRQIDFQNASVLTEADLDNSALQTFHVAQEAIDKADDALPLNTAGTEWDASISSNAGKITNVGTPSAGTDAANKSYVDQSTDVPTVASQISPTNNIQTVASQISPTNNISAVAGKATEIGRLGTADAVADMALLGTQDVVDDLALLAHQSVKDDMALLADAGVIEDMGHLGTNVNVTAMGHLGTGTNVTNMATVAGQITPTNNIQTVATNINNGTLGTIVTNAESNAIEMAIALG